MHSKVFQCVNGYAVQIQIAHKWQNVPIERLLIVPFEATSHEWRLFSPNPFLEKLPDGAWFILPYPFSLRLKQMCSVPIGKPLQVIKYSALYLLGNSERVRLGLKAIFGCILPPRAFP